MHDIYDLLIIRHAYIHKYKYTPFIQLMLIVVS